MLSLKWWRSINLPKYFSGFREARDNEIDQSYLKENQSMAHSICETESKVESFPIK